MAGSPVTSVNVLIYPTTAVFSASYVDDQATSSVDVNFSNTDCTVSNDHLVYGIYTTGYGTLTVVAYGHTYTQVISTSIPSDITVNLPSDNLYAWTSSTAQSYGFPTTFYTKTATIEVPTYGGTNLIFDANGNDITSTFLYGGTAHFSESSEQSITWSTSDPF